jgi:hypothetical protein
VALSFKQVALSLKVKKTEDNGGFDTDPAQQTGAGLENKEARLTSTATDIAVTLTTKNSPVARPQCQQPPRGCRRYASSSSLVAGLRENPKKRKCTKKSVR